MAGSYEHLLPREQGDPGWSHIENMGDAYECVEELFWLVEKCIGREEAKQQLRKGFYPMRRGEIPKDDALKFVERQMEL
jgi:hypothetical protein